MAGSVIDALVVTLGLDSKGFASGIKGSAGELAGFTRKLAGMFVAVKGLEDVFGYFKDLHTQLKDIGFEALGLGASASELSRLGEVAVKFGGNMQDAASATANLQNSVYGLKYNGDFTNQLEMLQRFGIPYLGANGQPLDMKSLLRNVSRYEDLQAKNGVPLAEREWQVRQMVPGAGGLAVAAALGSKDFESNYAKAKKDQSNETDKVFRDQLKLAQGLTSLHFEIQNKMVPALEKLTPMIASLSKDLVSLAGDVMKSLMPVLSRMANDLKTLVAARHNPKGTVAHPASGIASDAKSIWSNAQKLLGATGLEALAARLPVIGKYIALPGALDQAAHGHYLKAAEVGASALLPYAGLFVALDQLIERGLTRSPPPAGFYQYALEGGVPPPGAWLGRLPATPLATLGRAAPSAPSAREAASAGGAKSVTVNNEVGPVYIQTRATDAKGIAAGISSELRKRLASDADQGQR